MATTTEAPERGPNFVVRVNTFYHEVMTELKKVTWPDRPQTIDATWRIIVFVLLLGLLIWLIDLILQGVLVRGIPALFTGR
jgi:preprotein translocase subunit SecE